MSAPRPQPGILDIEAYVGGGFGIGVGLSGAQSDTLERNLISGNSVSGVQLSNTEDIATTGTRLTDNALSGNGVDVGCVELDLKKFKTATLEL